MSETSELNLEEKIEPVPLKEITNENDISVEAINEKLAEVTNLSEELDQTLKSAQQDCSVLNASTSQEPELNFLSPPIVIVEKPEDGTNSERQKPVKPDDLRSDDEFQTASDCTLQHSRSSSYNTASECENRYSPWWEFDKNINENLSKEKMVLAVGLPELPEARAVLKPSPEVPHGKIVHEVIETTHLKVQQSHTLGVKSFVLTSETIRNKGDEESGGIEEPVLARMESEIKKDSGENEFEKRMRECGDWLQLKILEITPELTKLGATLIEAIDLQKAHDEVLRQLQNKQSPVEELLRQADQLIATQKPRAEVYAAMAESLGRAWKDINFNLELRKQILDLNVQYHVQAEEFFEKIDALESSCTDTVIPVEISAVKNFLTTIHELRRTLLESLMGALQAGNSLLGKLKELGSEGTLDSRPEHIRQSVSRAISQVQTWLDQLHLRRLDVEATFNRRKLQLEQCLALAILATDLQDLEEKVHECQEMLANTHELGNSTSSADLLLHEHQKLLPEAKHLQDRALKMTKATEQLLASGCFAGQDATEQAYSILSATSDYLEGLNHRESLLERVLEFFKSSDMALNKLDQLEVQLTSTELPNTSPELAQLHAQCSKAIESITTPPITEGYSILEEVVSDRMSCDGVKQRVLELENRKIYLDGLCVAHKEENLRINKALNNFFEQYHNILTWLTNIAEAFLKGHQDMGHDLKTSESFINLHNQLLEDLQTKGSEINTLLLTLPPILEYLEDNQRKDVDSKVEEVHDRWMKLKTILENRLDLGKIYVKFHTEANFVNTEMDKLDSSIQNAGSDINDEFVKHLEIKWESLEPLYQCAKNTGLTFIDQAKKVSEPHLDTSRACMCVEAVLERLAGRQLVVTRTWQTFYTDIVEKKETFIRLEEAMAESTKTLSWVTKLDAQLYPVITTESSKPKEISSFLENKLKTVTTDIKRAQTEVEQRIKTTEQLISKTQTSDEKALNVKNKLSNLSQKLIGITREYQDLVESLISYFDGLSQLDTTTNNLNSQFEKTGPPLNVEDIRSLIREHESSRQAVFEMYNLAQNECDQIVQRIHNQEPPQAAEHDIEKLRHTIQLGRSNWDQKCRERLTNLENHNKFCSFDADLKQIYTSIGELDKHLQDIKGRYGKSLGEAKATSQAFVNFENTILKLDKRILGFIEAGEQLLAEKHSQSPQIEKHISELKDRWEKFKQQNREIRYLIDLSIEYFTLVEEADEWFKQGSKLLISIAKRTTSVKKPQEAQDLLNEITLFLRPGEEKQNQRIQRITDLAEKIYGKRLPKQVDEVLGENKEMLESFTIISRELNSLSSNLILAEEEKQKLLREQQEAEAKLEAAKLEMIAAAEAAALARKEKEAAELAARVLEEEAARKAEIARKEQQAAEEAAKALQEEIARKAEAARKEQETAELAAKALQEEAARKAEAARKEQEAAELAAIALQEQAEAARKEQEATQLAALQKEALKQKLEPKVHHIKIQRETTPQKSDRESSPEGVTFEELEAPIFITPLSDAVIQEGSKFSFICQVSGSPIPVVTWYKAGIPIQNNPDYHTTFDNGLCTLAIEETFGDDSAKYTCKAINAAGCAETTAFLSVKETEPEEQMSPPKFVKLLEASNVKENSQFELICRVEGNPLPNVQWFKNEECLDNSSEHYITYNNGEAVLKFEKIGLQEKGDYTCKAVNELGMAQTTASLNVTALVPSKAPEFIQPLSNIMARAGQKIKLECEVTGLPEPTLTWLHNGKILKETHELKLHREGDKATLVINEAFPKDAGTYSVCAENIAGKTTSESSVSVKGRLPDETSDSEPPSDMEPIKPSIQLPLTDVTISEGQRVRLDCVIVGQPEPEVIWYHNDKPVKESSDFQLLFQGDRCSLVIQEAFSEDAGDYKVVALNSAGEASSKCSLSIKRAPATNGEIKPVEEKVESTGTPPKFDKLLDDILVSEGAKVIFEGIVNGQPKPEIKWLLNNFPINANGRVKITHNDDGNIKLEIENVLPEDKGVYTVKAINQHGEAKCFAQLIVKSIKPPEIVKHEEIKIPPVFKELFYDKTAFEKTSTKFECIAIGKPTPKIKWLFNGKPIFGKNFLVSTSGDRQILSIPEVTKDDHGIILCVAENEIGSASCAAKLLVESGTDIALPERPLSEITQNVESSYSFKREIHTESSTSSSSKIITSSNQSAVPHVQSSTYVSQDAKTFKQINQEPPDIKELHKVEQIVKIGSDQPIIHEKSSSVYTVGSDLKSQTQIQTVDHSLLQKSIIKARPPKFISPVIGKIVDQNVNVILEGILDGSPIPTVVWTKNGQELQSTGKTTITWQLNKATLEIKNTTVQDAGRYTCTANNEAGTAASTADLVVRKTIFPPVLGRRLQAQVIKKGDKINMEVEVTGTPEPSISWFKNDIPLTTKSKDFRIKSIGNSHILTIDKAELHHTGRYMVKAANAGGEAQSIADVAVFEPTPDTMVEVVKTVVFEDIRKHETLTSAADQTSSSVEIQKPIEHIIKHVSAPSVTNLEVGRSQPVMSSKSEFSSFTEQQMSQKLETIRLEHKLPEIPQPKPLILEKQLDYEICQPESSSVRTEEKQESYSEDGGIETSSISKQSSLQYFVQKLKGEEEPVSKEIQPPAQIKPETYKKFETLKQETKFDRVVPPIKSQQAIPSFITPEIKESKTFITGQLVREEFRLTPEPPAEICYPASPSQSQMSQSEITKATLSKQSFEPKPEIKPLVKPAPPLPPQKPAKVFDCQDYTSQKFESLHQTTYVQKSEKEIRAVSPRPEALEMEKLWTPHKEIEKPLQVCEKPITRPHSSLLSGAEPSLQGIAMEKEWAHKFSETHVENSWPPSQSTSEVHKTQSSWSTQSTLERSWAPVQSIQPKISYVPHYIANVSHPTQQLEHRIMDTSQSQYTESHKSDIYREEIIEKSIKPSEIIKSWPPVQHVEFHPPSKPYPTMDQLTIRPVSVQDITDEVILEPGPPPEMGYAQPPKERRLSLVESGELEIQKSLQKAPAKVPPGGVRTIPPPIVRDRIIPPPLPPKKEYIPAPPIPAKPVKRTVESKPIEIFPQLEPFPFKPDPETPKSQKVRPPPTPSKFIKGRYLDSDYESDFESTKIPSKWKPCASDTDEPTYRKVRAPLITPPPRSLSTEPEPLPPSKFEHPSDLRKPLRPEIKSDFQEKIQAKKFTKHVTKHQEPIVAPVIKPGSPPLYMEQVKKPDSPKIKRKMTIDGYMADTDEPFMKQEISKSEYKREETSHYKQTSQFSEKIESSHTIETPKPQKFTQHKKHSSLVSPFTKELTETPIITCVSTERYSEAYNSGTKLDQGQYKIELSQSISPRFQPAASPSKFVKGEFRGSDYESDYDGKIPPLWRPDEKESEPSYKPVRPVLTPTSKRIQYDWTPTPPTEFERPIQVTRDVRPKFEPIEKMKPSVKLDQILKPEPKQVFKPKPVPAKVHQDMIIKPDLIPLKPGSPPEIVYATSPQKTQYYRSTTSAPYHNAVQTETSNIVHFNESTEKSHRTVSMQQTTKVIKFGDQYKQQQAKLDQLPYSPQPEKPHIRVPPPPTPKKFVPGEFRESDYESEVESTRIKPKWTPAGTIDALQFRQVRPPSTCSRSSSVPPHERVVTPMEFDKQSAYNVSNDVTDGEVNKYESSSYKKYSTTDERQLVSRGRSQEPTRKDLALQPGSPPEYGFVSDKNVKSTATKIATQHMDSMTQAFRSKTQKFATEIMNDVSRQPEQKPILKKGQDDDAQVYREETRSSQYGTKHVDPDTGLIYFKYDFGYEFGIILPGESKQGGIPVPKKTMIEPPKRTTDIELPVLHEISNTKPFGQSKPTGKFQPVKFNKSAKGWESESELSEYEGKNHLQGPRWEPSSCSPVSISPSLLSTSPAFVHNISGGADRRKGFETPPSCPSTPGSQGKLIKSSQARAPMFITPLRNIAVVSGQSAKFECIVQSEPPPNILWSKNGRILENCNDYELHYRNGVCRLTISKAYPEDAGTYSCTATNVAGTANTAAVLDVPGERKSLYMK